MSVYDDNRRVPLSPARRSTDLTRRSVAPVPAYGSDQQVILSGVKPGDRLVTEGIDRLTTGAKVSVVDSSETRAAAGTVSDKERSQAKN